MKTKTEKPDWPRKVTAKNGTITATVTVYQRQTPTGPGYMVAYRDVNGKRKFDSFKKDVEALQHAQTKAQTLSMFGARVAQTSPADVAAMVGAADVLKPFNVTLAACAQALARWLGLHQTLDSIESVLTAYRADAARSGQVASISVKDAVENFLEKKNGNGSDKGASELHCYDLKKRLERFATAFNCEVQSITGPLLQGWFDQQKFSRSNYMHWRRVLNIFFQYCVARGHTLANPVQAVEIFTVERAKVAIYTPEQMRKMIKASDPDFRLFLLFGGFAGLRPSEVYEEATDDARLDWQEVDFKAGYIVVTDENKTGERLVPILPNLREWLTPLAQKKGKVFGRAMTLGALRRRMIKKSGVPWIQDGLRHSWISYRLAELGDVNRVAGEAGNSPKIIKQNYKAIRTPDKQLVTPALAREWFGIMPEKTGS